jgi:hypothetical protein
MSNQPSEQARFGVKRFDEIYIYRIPPSSDYIDTTGKLKQARLKFVLFGRFNPHNIMPRFGGSFYFHRESVPGRSRKPRKGFSVSAIGKVTAQQVVSPTACAC